MTGTSPSSRLPAGSKSPVLRLEAAPPPTPLLTQEEAVVLAPLLTTALFRATPEQRIRFLARSGSGLVEGVMFAENPSSI